MLKIPKINDTLVCAIVTLFTCITVPMIMSLYTDPNADVYSDNIEAAAMWMFTLSPTDKYIAIAGFAVASISEIAFFIGAVVSAVIAFRKKNEGTELKGMATRMLLAYLIAASYLVPLVLLCFLHYALGYPIHI